MAPRSSASRAPLDDDVAGLIAASGSGSPELGRDVDAQRGDAVRIGAFFRGEVDPQLRAIPTLDMLVEGIRVRWYGPQLAADVDVVVYLHGGGWVVGDIDSYDDDVRLLARRTGAAVVSVDYRRAPEHPFPAPLDDCLTVIRHVAGLAHRALALAGDSAGGNLALAAARELSGVVCIDAVLALYPCVDPAGGARDSYRANAEGYLLTSHGMQDYWAMYVPDDSLTDPRAALLEGDLAGMPAVVLASAGYDPLLDEDRELAACLVAADVAVTYLPHPALPHGFQQMVPRIPAARRALDAVYAAFVVALARATAERTSAHSMIGA